MHAEPSLDLRRDGRERVIRRRSRADDQIDILSRQPGMLQRRLRRPQAEHRRRLAFGGDVALTDASALDDPLVGGLDDAFEIGVRHELSEGDMSRSPRPRNGYCSR
jgi:hypothetical protein